MISELFDRLAYHYLADDNSRKAWTADFVFAYAAAALPGLLVRIMSDNIALAVGLLIALPLTVTVIMMQARRRMRKILASMPSRASDWSREGTMG